MLSPTREEFLEQYAYIDRRNMVGKVVLAPYISCVIGNKPTYLHLNPPATVIVLPESENEIYHWVDDWLDPSWDVALALPHPELEGASSLMISAKAYHRDCVQTSPVSWDLSPDQSLALPEVKSCPTS